jgi:XTP/dITP diphosphohydrolase
MTAPRTLEVRFLSSNSHKIAEAQSILGKAGIRLIATSKKIEELQTADTSKLVRDKVLKAFAMIGRPLFVEHTGLHLANVNGLPGGLTQVFWDTLEAELFARLFGATTTDARAHARTTIAYCDGKRIYEFSGDIEGCIVSPPRGPRDFQWDCVFQPSSHDTTFAEMGPHKNEISMRRIALDKLAAHITNLGAS